MCVCLFVSLRQKKKIFVGGLSADTTDEHLKEYFSKYGPIQESVVKADKATERSRRFGFITFETEDACLAALDEDVFLENFSILFYLCSFKNSLTKPFLRTTKSVTRESR